MFHSITKTAIVLDSIEGVEQRCQISTPHENWEICWDIQEQRVVAWAAFDGKDNAYTFSAFHVSSDQMTLADILHCLGYTDAAYTRTLEWCDDPERTLAEVLASPVCSVDITQILCVPKETPI